MESPECIACGDPVDNAEHTFFIRSRWARMHSELDASVGGGDVTSESIISIMLNSRKKWEAVGKYVRTILRTKE